MRRNVPIGAGLAFANKYRGNDSVAFTYFGDGASSQGDVNEAFIFAASSSLMALQPCPACKGARLRPESLAVTVDGRREKASWRWAMPAAPIPPPR